MISPPTLSDPHQRRRVGRFFLDLVEDPSWVLRRVETIHILGSKLVERRVTLDIDYPNLVARARAHHLPWRDGISVPLLRLRKDLLLDIDIRSAGGNPLAIATSDQDSAVAQCLIMAHLEEKGFSTRTLPGSFAAAVLEVARNPRVGERQIVVRAKDESASAAALACPGLVDLLASFADTFMVVVTVPPGTGTTIVKYRNVEYVDFTGDFGALARLGINPPQVSVEGTDDGRSQRGHVRIVAPGDTRLGAVVLIDKDKLLSGVPYQVRATPERSLVYTSGPRPANYRILVELLPDLGKFHLPALFIVGLNLFLLICGLYLQFLYNRFADSLVRDSAVAVFTLGPSLVAAYLARKDEHDLVSRMLTFPRAMVLCSAVSTAVVGAAVAVNISPATLGLLILVATVITWSTFSLLLLTTARTLDLQKYLSRSVWGPTVVR